MIAGLMQSYERRIINNVLHMCSNWTYAYNDNDMKENKLILEFMGYPKIANDEDKIDYLEDCVKYHESWDWLMPVVEKIETLGYTFEKNYQPIDKDWQSLIVKGNDILYQEFNDDSLKSSYYVLVEFIKQYNNERNRSN